MNSKELKDLNSKRRLAGAKKSFVLKLLTLAILFAIGLGLTLGYLHKTLPHPSERTNKLEISANVNASPENKSLVTVEGSLSAPGQVTIYLNDTLVGYIATGSDAKFKFEPIALRPGNNQLRLSGLPRDVNDEKYSPAVFDETLNWTPSNSDKPKLLLPRSKIVNTVSLVVDGVAFPKGKLFVSVLQVDKNVTNRDSLQWSDLKNIGDSIPTQSDDQGSFRAKINLTAPGKYLMLVKSDINDPHPAYTWEQPEIIFDPFRTARTMITIGYGQTRIDYEVTLSRDSMEAQGLITGTMPFPQFVDELSRLRVAGEFVAFDFWDVDPAITATSEAVTVKATAFHKRSGELPIVSGRISISKDTHVVGQQIPVVAASETIAIKVNDYSVTSYYPLPTLLNKEEATWIGGQKTVDFSPEIQIGLNYNPLKSPARLIRLLTLSPWHLFGYQVAIAYYPLEGFLASIPILWVLWQLRRYRGTASIDDGLANQLRLICYLLMLIIYVGPTTELVPILMEASVSRFWILLPQRFWLMPGSPLPLYPGLLLGAGIVLVSCLMLWITKRLQKGRISFWIRASLGSLGVAIGISFLLKAVIDALDQAYGSLRSRLPIIILSWFVMLLVIFCVRALLRFLPSGHVARSRILFLLVFLLSLCFAYPFGTAFRSLPVSYYERSIGDVAARSVDNLLFMMQDVAPYVLLVGMVVVLRSSVRTEDTNPMDVDFGWVLFAGFIVGSTPNWFMVPVPFLLALWLYPRIVAEQPERRDALALVRKQAVEKRKSSFVKAFSAAQAGKFLDSLDSLTKKVTSGELTLAEFEKRKVEIENYNSLIESENTFPGGLQARDVVLSFGPLQTNWANGVYAAKRGLIIALPFLLLYLWKFVLQQIGWDRTLLGLWLAIRVMTFVVDWALAAFFFGYFFPYLRGNSGLKKGLHLAVAIIVCSIPFWFLYGSSAVELTATFLRAGQIFLFFTVLGLWAFDYYTFREALGEQFSWKKFAQFGDMPSLTAFASVLITSSGVAIASVISGQFASVLSHIVTSLFPQLPGPPTK